MMDASVESLLQSISRDKLTSVVRRALGSSTVNFAEWRYAPLTGGSTTTGAFLLSGSAHDGGEIHAWSITRPQQLIVADG